MYKRKQIRTTTYIHIHTCYMHVCRPLYPSYVISFILSFTIENFLLSNGRVFSEVHIYRERESNFMLYSMMSLLSISRRGGWLLSFLNFFLSFLILKCYELLVLMCYTCTYITIYIYIVISLLSPSHNTVFFIINYLSTIRASFTH